MVNLSVFNHLGPLLGTSGPFFGPFQTEMIFLPQMDKVGFGRGATEQNINSAPYCCQAMFPSYCQSFPYQQYQHQQQCLQVVTFHLHQTLSVSGKARQ